MHFKKMIKQCLLMAGIFLWIGVMGPEIYVDGSMGCLMDENGKALAKEETEELLEKWFYSTQEEQGEKPVIVYKSVLLERLERNWK